MRAGQPLRGGSGWEHRRLLVCAGDHECAGFNWRKQSTALPVRYVRDIGRIKWAEFAHFCIETFGSDGFSQGRLIPLVNPQLGLPHPLNQSDNAPWIVVPQV